MPETNNPQKDDAPKAITRLVNKLTKEMLWIYILRLLQERPHYGYEIKQLIHERFGFAPATVSGYAIIYRLIKDGLIEEQRREDSPRKYYAITNKGSEAMTEAKAFLTRTMERVFDKTD
ncbi:MAG: PadR family transcriptional regulator [Candidatus Thorarchaeota archaeon]|nr:MAG: PadR family transcriptional regulator [Candidatus Thorarchaeota archaeon]RLI59249.1 MAG: PadR family transcriptional regulator [Candidatus Thorarchaeota archaeon]